MGRTGGMPTSEWSIETPTSLEFDDVTGLRVRLIAGSVAVLATTGKPTLEVSSIEGDPLNVTLADGLLTVAHENLSWEGLLKWLRPPGGSARGGGGGPGECGRGGGRRQGDPVEVRPGPPGLGQERLRRDPAGQRHR